ncbi:MAG: hypothetical protein ACTSYX_05720 [Candidatus Thorarchaeota archaeon]
MSWWTIKDGLLEQLHSFFLMLAISYLLIAIDIEPTLTVGAGLILRFLAFILKTSLDAAKGAITSTT